MTKHKEREEDIIKKKNSHHEEEIELADMERKKAEPEKEEPAEIKDYKKLAEEYLNNWKRALADFENYKKQQVQSQKEFAKFANLSLIMQILPVLDNFHASTDHIPEGQKNDPWVVGIMHIQKQLENVLKDNGIEEIEAEEGDEFDPVLHEAVQKDTKETNSDTKETNKVKKVIQKGYKVGDKVIRPARVIVS